MGFMTWYPPFDPLPRQAPDVSPRHPVLEDAQEVVTAESVDEQIVLRMPVVAPDDRPDPAMRDHE